MKRLLLLCVIASFNTHAQTVYLADTAFVTDAGHDGAPASCKANGLTYNSVNMDRSQGIWAADVFTVPAGATWVFDTVTVFGYQYGSSLSSPFLSCNLQIYNGAPGLGGTVIWGDTVTNVLNNSAFTGIYKVDTFASDSGLLSTKRPIMYLKLYLPQAPQLGPGTYWLSWSAAGISTSNPATSPFKVLPGRVNPPGQMARAFVGGQWQYITDNGQSIGLNMMISAKANLAVPSIENGNPANMLGQDAPNPFHNTTTISYNLGKDSYATLSVYNVIGQLVAVLANGYMGAGAHSVVFNAGNLPAGAYYYKLSTATGTESKQMILVK